MDRDQKTNELFNQVMSLSDSFREKSTSLFENGIGDPSWRLQNFPIYAPRQAITKFIVREEMFRKVLNIQGSIIECGVFGGGGLFAWLHLSSIFEPLNYLRKIIGFDTFAGFPGTSKEDCSNAADKKLLQQGALALNCYDHLLDAGNVHGENMLFSKSNKLALVRGDATKTIPAYLEQAPETIVSLLYLDFDIFTPTKVALEYLVPRMPRGAILAFDEANDPTWPGETLALLQTLGIRTLKLERFSYDTKVSYAVLD